MKVKKMKNINDKEAAVYAEESIVSTHDVLSKDDLLKALDSDFATNVSKIYVNSLKREVGFREINVQEQKNLSRILVANENRKDVVYDAQCAMINKTALDDGFNIYNLTEFDRIKLLMALYQQNMFADEVKFTCPVCSTENTYRVNFDNALAKLDEFDLSPKTFTYENKNLKYVFTTAYPNVSDISKFHKMYFASRKARNYKEQTMMNSMFNIEYINLFIKSVVITSKANGVSRYIDFSDYNLIDLEDIFAKFSQDVMYSDNGLIKFITEEYLNSVNKAFDKHICMNCGATYEKENSNQVESFF